MKLIYSDNYIKSYTDDLILGDGIAEIDLITNEFVILNLDESVFEKIIFNDGEYVIQNGTSEIVARKFIPNEDFFSLSFDCNLFLEDDKFVLIHINGRLKKIEKAKYIIEYFTWIDYVKKEYVKLKRDNLLQVRTNYGNKFLESSINHIYSVKEMINNQLVLVSTSTGCCKCTEEIEGVVKWRDENKLLVDICVID